jgi:predicted amino acid dehydrogenase
MYQNEPHLKGKPLSLIKKLLIETPPKKVTELVGVKSILGQELQGYGYSIGLLPEQFFELDKKLVRDRIIKCCELAIRDGVQVVALGAYTAPATNQGLDLVDKFKNIGITTGNSFTAAETIEAVKEASKLLNISLKESTVTVIGATGSIGSACSQVLAEMSAHIILVARNMKKLNDLKSNINAQYPDKASIGTSILESVKHSNIIVIATSAPYALIDQKDFNHGSIIVDVSIPRNVSIESGFLRNDVLILDGGMMKPPGNLRKSSFNIGLPAGVAPACLCEAMILAFENRAESFSLGLGLETKKVKEIYALGKKHGFKLAGFLSFGKPLKKEFIDLVQANVLAGAVK